MHSKAIIGLVNPKSPTNVGSVLRAAGCFGVDEIYYSGSRYTRAAEFTKGHGRIHHSDTQNASKRVALNQSDDLLAECEPAMKIVCVELVEGAKALPSFTHPEQALYIFGPEDGSIPQKIIDAADEVVFMPTKGCLNLAATVNVLLYDRVA
ncbi:MAG: RNA methyltransferase, partial [Sinobacterium sp.]|nr:RNA methyltransferase [Sinobacterium sp.]